MAYSELVKTLDHVRSYMREFYVYGFKSRDDYAEKSLRSYDDEKRRLESWLGDYMKFRRTADGKYAFISIDSRHVRHNPLYKAWKAKSFTNGDITLHFILFDILNCSAAPLSLADIMEKLDTEYLCHFHDPMIIDESTVRKKLKEYAAEGILNVAKDGKKSVYSASNTCFDAPRELLDFFSEVAPCGVIGSFLLDKSQAEEGCFTFKHHYITGAIDSDILYKLLDAISRNAFAEIVTSSPKRKTAEKLLVLPLQMYISVQNGRQHLMAWRPDKKRLCTYRLDYITDVTPTEICDDIDEYREVANKIKPHMWGVVTPCGTAKTQHVEFTVHADNDEMFIYRRLLREKRCGTVEAVDDNTFRFSADVYDINEMVPWIRTFICRITSIKMSDKRLENQFKADMAQMYEMYGVGGDVNAV